MQCSLDARLQRCGAQINGRRPQSGLELDQTAAPALLSRCLTALRTETVRHPPGPTAMAVPLSPALGAPDVGQLGVPDPTRSMARRWKNCATHVAPFNTFVPIFTARGSGLPYRENLRISFHRILGITPVILPPGSIPPREGSGAALFFQHDGRLLPESRE